MTELKRCPFCEGKGKISEKIVDYNGRRIYEYMCYCAECFCSTPPYPIKDDAIRVWNERPNPWHTGTPTEDGWYLLLYKSIGGEFIPETKHFNFFKNIIEMRPDVFMDIYPLWQKLELPTDTHIEKIEPYKEKKDGHTD